MNSRPQTVGRKGSELVHRWEEWPLKIAEDFYYSFIAREGVKYEMHLKIMDWKKYCELYLD